MANQSWKGQKSDIVLRFVVLTAVTKEFMSNANWSVTPCSFVDTTFLPIAWEQQQQVLPKHRYLSTDLHHVVSRKTLIFRCTADWSSSIFRGRLRYYSFFFFTVGRQNKLATGLRELGKIIWHVNFKMCLRGLRGETVRP